MPSLYESFGMVALEAMSCGTPVIASEVGGLGYLVQDGVTGYTVPDSDPAAIRNKLTVLLGNSPLRVEMGERAAAYAKDYDWAKIAGAMLSLYEEAVQEQRADRV